MTEARTVESAREFLELCAEHGDRRAAQVLEHGREFEMKPMPEGVRRGPMGECFANATRAASERFSYVEGYAGNGLWWVAHAWLVDNEDGQGFDLTWDADVESGDYFGVVIPLRRLNEMLLQRRMFGVLDVLATS